MDLNSLKAALKPLSDFGQDEYSFGIPQSGGQDLDVTLRALLPKEEVACQRYANDILARILEEEGMVDSDSLTRATALQYFDMYRAEVVAYALAQVGDINFRGIQYIETGEMTEGPTPVKVKVKRHVAIRGIIEDTWGRGMITIGFAKYGELVSLVARQASKVAKDSVADLDAEIDREEKYLASLKEDREARAKGDPSVTSSQIQNLMTAGKVLEEEIDQAMDTRRVDRRTANRIRGLAEETEVEMALEEAARIDAEAKSASGEEPQPALEDEPTPTPEPRRSVIPPTAPPPTTPEKPNPPQFRSSFEEQESQDSQAIEEDRVRAARKEAVEASRNSLGATDLSSASQPGVIKLPDGSEVEAVRMPAEVMSPRTKKAAEELKGARGKVRMDPIPGEDQRNPNFKPSGG